MRPAHPHLGSWRLPRSTPKRTVCERSCERSANGRGNACCIVVAMHSGTTFSSRPFEHLIAEVADLKYPCGAAGSPDNDPPTSVGKLQRPTSTVSTTLTGRTETSEAPGPVSTEDTTATNGFGAPTYLARIRLATLVLPTDSPTETGRTETGEDPDPPSRTEATTDQGPVDGFDDLLAAAEFSVRASESRPQPVEVGTVSGVSMGGTARQVTAAAVANGGWLDASSVRSDGRVSVFRRRLARAGAVTGNLFDGDRLIVAGRNLEQRKEESKMLTLFVLAQATPAQRGIFDIFTELVSDGFKAAVAVIGLAAIVGGIVVFMKTKSMPALLGAIALGAVAVGLAVNMYFFADATSAEFNPDAPRVGNVGNLQYGTPDGS